jgi:hypothetical protein
MAISSIGSTYPAGQVTPVAKSVAPTPQSSSAASSIVISKVTVTNPDGSTTTIITYADGHTETETTRAATHPQSSASPASAPPSSGGRGQLVNLLA